ncbi:MAG: GHMP kinase, partial [Desulfuromonadales bacterium]|nr:GHMP kinase [Desulfuromonadales bacterium]NIS43282.1 GHMP kinase [Desulfuromonadales bacterium]
TALPALVERDFSRFSRAVAELQRAVGDHFAPFQGGRYASPVIAEVLAWLAAEGVEGRGQSSWGPTGFALLPSEDDCRRILDKAPSRWANHDALEFRICPGRNRGSEIEVNEHVCG